MFFDGPFIDERRVFEEHLLGGIGEHMLFVWCGNLPIELRPVGVFELCTG